MILIYHIPNNKVELFLSEANKIIPEIKKKVENKGDTWSIIDFKYNDLEDGINISVFAETFNKLHFNKN